MTDFGPIIHVADLEQLGDTMVVCDVRWYLDGPSGIDAYRAGHIPGAVFVDLDSHLAGPPSAAAGRHPLPEPADFADALGGLGIGPAHTVVAYDDVGGMVAGRLVWMLRILGQSAALLDGGLDAWAGPWATGETKPTPVDCQARSWPDSALVDIGQADIWVDQGILLDARDAERYRGDTEPVDSRAGHIPGARSAPFADNLRVDGRFRSTDQLRERYAALGVADAGEAVVYCGSGVSACHDLLAMEHAGLGRGRLYPGSWSQWSASDRPSIVGPRPDDTRLPGRSLRSRTDPRCGRGPQT